MIALISDIHGNYIALAEVLRAIDGLNVEATYCLGDVAGYYPQINECCEALRQRAVPSVLGNHDWHLVSGTSCPRSKAANDCLRYQRQIIAEANLAWLASFPAYLKIGELALVHGGWTNPIDEYLVPTEEQFRAIPDRYAASGHTHKPVIASCDGKVYCNPGSVGQPRDGCHQAAFATFDGQEFRLFRIDYDIDRACQVMAAAGFSEYYYNRLRTGAAHFGLPPPAPCRHRMTARDGSCEVDKKR